jgi:cytidine deaminase
MTKKPTCTCMSKKNLVISYALYSQLEELPPKDRELAERAQASQALSYAPYSHFRVGATIRLEDGRLIGSANQENAAYSMCLCAERTAIATAASIAPGVRIAAIAVTASAERKLVSPCGACRQVLNETEIAQGLPIQIILQGAEGSWLVFDSAKDILPFPFSPENLGKAGN